MNRVRRFLCLSFVERWLIVKATGLLAVIRFGLWLLPFPTARRLLLKAGRSCPRLVSNRQPVEQYAWAVAAVSRLVPGGGHCLSQALTVQTFLARRGYASEICFGVQRLPGVPFTAHAWVEHNGVVLIGGDYLSRFVRLRSSADALS
jgi:hypothetical protein